METIKLPKGVTIHHNGQKYKEEIPKNLCPPKYLPKKEQVAPKKDSGKE